MNLHLGGLQVGIGETLFGRQVTGWGFLSTSLDLKLFHDRKSVWYQVNTRSPDFGTEQISAAVE